MSQPNPPGCVNPRASTPSVTHSTAPVSRPRIRNQGQLIDCLTPEQHQVNRRLLEFSHEPHEEIEVLRSDLKSLEAAIRIHRRAHEKEKISHQATQQNLQRQESKRQESERYLWLLAADANNQNENHAAALATQLDESVSENEKLKSELRCLQWMHVDFATQLEQLPILQEQLEDANQRAIQWQDQTSRGNASKRAALEQADRLKCLLIEKASELDSIRACFQDQLKSLENNAALSRRQEQVHQLRNERLRAKLNIQATRLRAIKNELARIKHSRTRIESKYAIRLGQKALAIRSLESLLLQRERDLGYAREEAHALVGRVTQQEQKITQLNEIQAKLVLLQSTQYEKLRVEIETMVAKLAGQREENRALRIRRAEQEQISDRVISLLTQQRDAFARYHRENLSSMERQCRELARQSEHANQLVDAREMEINQLKQLLNRRAA